MRIKCCNCLAELDASCFYPRRDRPGQFLAGCRSCRSAGAKVRNANGRAAALLLTAEDVRRSYALNQETGEFRDNATGAIVGADAHGYVRLKLAGVGVQGHRAAWLMYHGEWPSAEIDHEDHDRVNNRRSNLRLAPDGDNARNMSRSKRNKSGVVGVSWYEARHKWVAQIHTMHEGRRRNLMLGHFSDFDAAVKVRKQAERDLGYHPNHGSEPPSQQGSGCHV